MDRTTYNVDDALGRFRGTFSETTFDTPNFHSLVKEKARLPLHDYEWYRYDYVARRVQTGYGFKTNEDFPFGHTYSVRDALNTGVITNPSGSMSCDKIAALTAIVTNRLLSKVRNSEIDLGVAFGERRETALFVASAMKKVAKSYVQLRRGNVSGALRTITGTKNNNWRDIPGAASNTWLAYTYGLRPLLQDVYGACSVLEKRHKPIPEITRVKSGTVKPLKFNLVGPDIYGDTVSTRVVATVVIRGEVRFSTVNPLLKTMDSFGLLNPLAIAWELVPFSFVVDWFLPVGQFVTNIVPPQGVQFVDGWVSAKITGSCLSSTFRPASDSFPIGCDTKGESIERWKLRTVLTSFPKYYVRVPDVSLSNSQLASGMALLYQAVSLKRRNL